MKAKSRTKKPRIGHEITGVGLVRPSDDPVPRGWIRPNGKFSSTSQHWAAISKFLRAGGGDDPVRGERNAHVAYSLGWISLGHGGAINAIGHENVFQAPDHPAVVTLRKLVAKIPHFSLRVERQIGEIDPESGKHEDFDVTEYDLLFFVRRGRLKKTT